MRKTIDVGWDRQKLWDLDDSVLGGGHLVGSHCLIHLLF